MYAVTETTYYIQSPDTNYPGQVYTASIKPSGQGGKEIGKGHAG